jgi:hypothetical protein
MSEATILYFSFMFCLAGTVAGFIFGWFGNAYYTSYHQERELEDIHPEFLDSNGNYIEEELLAVRFIDSDELESEDD